MLPGIDGFHWTVTHVVFLTLFFAIVVTILATLVFAVLRTKRDFRTNGQLSCAGNQTLRSCRNPIGAAAMNWRAELCRELVTTLSTAATAGNTPSLPCCPQPD